MTRYVHRTLGRAGIDIGGVRPLGAQLVDDRIFEP